MASTTATNPDTLVTLKINIEGTNRRYKLPLRDLGASTLPEKLRFLLAIPPSSDVVFERYSDSAAAFITLDSNNASVYKQLYRAAKAKLKLRLKVTVMHTEPVVPNQATVEDELPSLAEHVSTPVVAEQPHEYHQAPKSSSPAVVSSQESVPNETSAPSVSEMQRGFEHLLTSRTSYGYPSTVTLPFLPARPVVSNDSEVSVTQGANARDRWLAELAGVHFDRQTAIRNGDGPPAVQSTYSVYCNKCNHPIPDEHYHCSTCDDGDFDLCQDCVNKGVLCNGEDHWMIKRFVKNGKVIVSTTETIAPRPTYAESKVTLVPAEESNVVEATRTCNSCIQEFPEQDFVTCTTCDDFDLCIPCHVSLQHGHHPKHAFAPAVDDAVLDPLARALLEPGRNASHSAVCDGCDKYIYGVRNKCLDCPDWDYCSTCIINSSFIHPGHRFVPIYEAVSDVATTQGVSDRKVRHHGIYCDGPLCCGGSGPATYIVGDRYKCAVCHDTDFCANCETSPSNQHNKTHPLIKIKTPIRNVSVTTMGDHDSGVPHPIMGDRICTRRGRTASKSTETPLSANAATQVQTVADLKPVEVIKAEELEAAILEETKSEEIKSEEATPESLIDEPLVAHFVRDAVQDGTVLLPNCVFEQTWVLRNGGKSSWPAGCTVKFVGGDNMCAVDPEHPASVHELVSAAESTTCFREVAPGQEFGFTVLMRTPNRAGKVISYWRLTGPTGTKFGHRLWCDVNVSEPVPVIKEEPKDVIPEVNDVVDEPEAEHSQMIFPKLDKESPVTSIHQEVAETEAPVADDFDEFVDENADLEDDETEDGFLTDEEYDILDASDEEYLAEQGKAVKK